MDRRSFLKRSGGICFSTTLGNYGFGGPLDEPSLDHIGLHPFIEAHPEAVFIRKTNLASKDDAGGKKKEAEELAGRIFTLKKGAGLPLSGKLAFKPNLTSSKGTGLTYGIVTDPFVVEGLIEGIKKMPMDPRQIYIREGLSTEQPVTGFSDMARRSGVHYGDEDSRIPTTLECPGGVVFRRTKYLGPFAHEDSQLINVAKFKTHSMGLTLCVKNLQGTNINPYIRFCGGLQNVIAQDFQPDAQAHVDEIFTRHRKAGLPRWETDKAAWMEMWIQRTIDSYSLIKPKVLLNVIEGVYAQNGDGFDGGPGKDGTPEIFMTNMLIFGKDAFRVDIIGHWIGGHEPGNFGLFHIGQERRVSNALNPRNIPVYIWEDSGPQLTPLDKVHRTPLATPYLPRNEETKFHMCDQAFSYPSESPSAHLSGQNQSALRTLGSGKPHRSSSSHVVMEFTLPKDGPVRLEISNVSGECLHRWQHDWLQKGIHMTEWNTRRISPGTYFGRLTSPGMELFEAFQFFS